MIDDIEILVENMGNHFDQLVESGVLERSEKPEPMFPDDDERCVFGRGIGLTFDEEMILQKVDVRFNPLRSKKNIFKGRTVGLYYPGMTQQDVRSKMGAPISSTEPKKAPFIGYTGGTDTFIPNRLMFPNSEVTYLYNGEGEVSTITFRPRDSAAPVR